MRDYTYDHTGGGTPQYGVGPREPEKTTILYDQAVNESQEASRGHMQEIVKIPFVGCVEVRYVEAQEDYFEFTARAKDGSVIASVRTDDYYYNGPRKLLEEINYLFGRQ